MTYSPPTDPVRYARLRAVMAHCLSLSLARDARLSADRCVRDRQRRADARLS